jgi:hypothetical protein
MICYDAHPVNVDSRYVRTDQERRARPLAATDAGAVAHPRTSLAEAV